MELVDFGRFAASFVLVIGLIGLLALFMRRYGAGSAKVKRGEEARLELLEIMPLDGRHRLLLVRRDNVQHLLVSGPDGVRVVEEGIAVKAGQNSKKTEKKRAA